MPLATLWRSWGIEPAAVLGHSVGEFAAACVAGVFSLEDGIRLIAQRARLMQAPPPGGRMAAVFAAEPQVIAAIAPYGDRITIAALNAPESIVISGDAEAVDEVLARLETQGIKSKPLATSHAFHSQRMDPMLEALRQVAATVACSKPAIDIVSNLTGQLADEHTFADSILLEPPRSLAGAVCPEHASAGRAGLRDLSGDRSEPDAHRFGPALPGTRRLRWLPSLRPGRDDWQSMLESLGQLYVRGAKLDWAGFDRPYSRCKVSLPTYPFQRTRYWAGVLPRGKDEGGSLKDELTHPSAFIPHPLLGSPHDRRRAGAGFRGAVVGTSAGDVGRSQDSG